MTESTATTATTAPAETGPVLRRLSVLDRWLPAWIIGAMVLGLVLGRFIPGLGHLPAAPAADRRRPTQEAV